MSGVSVTFGISFRILIRRWNESLAQSAVEDCNQLIFEAEKLIFHAKMNGFYEAAYETTDGTNI